MMQQRGKKRDNDNNKNERDDSLDNINNLKETCLDITSPSMMDQCGNNKHNTKKL